MWGWEYGYGPGWGAFGLFHMLLWWVLILLGIIVLARWLFVGGRRRPREDRALDILRERYARGEIDKAEFDARKKDLQS